MEQAINQPLNSLTAPKLKTRKPGKDTKQPRPALTEQADANIRQQMIFVPSGNTPCYDAFISCFRTLRFQFLLQLKKTPQGALLWYHQPTPRFSGTRVRIRASYKHVQKVHPRMQPSPAPAQSEPRAAYPFHLSPVAR